MANLSSSKKDIRKSKKRHEVNSQKRHAIRTYEKNVLKAIKEGKKEEATKLYNTYASLLDKAAKTNIIHKKNASRNKSKVSVKINALK